MLKTILKLHICEHLNDQFSSRGNKAGANLRPSRLSADVQLIRVEISIRLIPEYIGCLLSRVRLCSDGC